MGVQLSTVQKTAITKITSSTPVPPNEIIAVIFDPLSQVNWRDADFTLPESQETIESFVTHTEETKHVQHLFSYVAKLLDAISSAATSGALSTTGKGAKESANQVLRTTNLARLASVLLFNVIQQCAGNPFVLLRLTNSENEAAMTMLGAAAELIVRVPFNTLTAALHAETTELIRFSFSTRLFGPGLSLAKDNSFQFSSMMNNSHSTGNYSETAANTNNNHGSSNHQEEGNNNNDNSENSVRDPFLRRLALGQRDALLTKALVHSLLQRVIIWSNVLRGKERPTTWVQHQRASNISAPQDPHPSLASSNNSISNIVSPNRNHQSTNNSQTSNPNAGIGSKMFGWFFGGNNNNNNNNNSQNTSSSFQQQQSSFTSAPYSNAGVSKTASSAEAIVGSSSLHLLLSLLFFERGSHSAGKSRNTAVDVIRQLRGLDSNTSSGKQQQQSSSSSNNNHSSGSYNNHHQSLSPVLGGDWPQELVETIATLVPSHYECVLLLYSLLIDCPSFAKSIAQSSNHGLHVQVTHMTVDIVKTAVERPSSPESLFSAVVVAMIARIDPVVRCMFSDTRLREVPEYFARESPFVSTNMFIGAFLVLAITKVIFRASMGDGQSSIGASWLAALVNLSPFVMNLETAVEQKLSSLFIALLRRTTRLKAEVKNNSTAFAAAAQLDTAYAHLDILGTAIFQMVADPERNPTLLYELLYHKDKLSQLTIDWIEGDAIWRALKPITYILDRIETEVSSLSTQRSIPAILDIIRNLGKIKSSSNKNNKEDDDGEKMTVRIQLKRRDQMGGGIANDATNSSSSSSDDDEDDQTNESAGETSYKLRYPKITVIGADEEVTLTSYDFEENEDDENSGGNNHAIVPESFFATVIWYYVLQTDGKIEPPGCLRHGALGFSHGEAFPIFRTK